MFGGMSILEEMREVLWVHVHDLRLASETHWPPILKSRGVIYSVCFLDPISVWWTHLHFPLGLNHVLHSPSAYTNPGASAVEPPYSLPRCLCGRPPCSLLGFLLCPPWGLHRASSTLWTPQKPRGTYLFQCCWLESHVRCGPSCLRVILERPPWSMVMPRKASHQLCLPYAHLYVPPLLVTP